MDSLSRKKNLLRSSAALAGAATRWHLADIGRAALPCVALFAVATGVLEFFRPGITSTAVAPQLLALIAVVALGLALLVPAPVNRDARGRRSAGFWAGLLAYLLIAGAVSAFAFWGASYYFAEVKEARGLLTAAIGGTVTLLLFACAPRVPEDI
jgi:hypothetical protein